MKDKTRWKTTDKSCFS